MLFLNRGVKGLNIFCFTGEVVNLHQTFSARGTLGRYMSTQILLNGRLPAVDPSASVTIEKFQGEYHRTGRGQIESASSVAITLEGNNIGLTVTQVIEFDELPGCGSRFSTFITETSVLIARYDSQRHFAGIAMRTTVEDAETRQPDGRPLRHAVVLVVIIIVISEENDNIMVHDNVPINSKSSASQPRSQGLSAGIFPTRQKALETRLAATTSFCNHWWADI